ncbi:MAG: LD-carboxypeptidase [Candidatus Hydrogenedentota bacterium]
MKTPFRIAVVAPSGPPKVRELLKGQRQLRDRFGPMEFQHSPRLRNRLGYLAGDDDARAASLEWAFSQKKITHVWFARGGFGTTRIIDRIPWKRYAATRKILLGYSDATSFLLAHAAAGGRALHSPMIATDIAAGGSVRTWESLGRIVFGPGQETYSFSAKWYSKGVKAMQGSILPGNIAVLAAMAGTPEFPDGSGKVICLEEVKEEPYRVDRLLTQLLHAGLFRRAAGIVFGSMTGCVPENPRKSLSLDEVFRRFARETGLPVVAGYPFGHGGVNSVMPVFGMLKLRGNRTSVSVPWNKA